MLVFNAKNLRLLIAASFLLVSIFCVAQKEQKYTLEDASEFIRNKHEGRVLSAKTSKVDGQTVHRIQVLSKKGRVKVYQVDENVLKQNKPIDNKRNNNKYSPNNSRQIKRQKNSSRTSVNRNHSYNRQSSGQNNTMTSANNRTSRATKNSSNESKNK